jgi:hypothetical protein
MIIAVEQETCPETSNRSMVRTTRLVRERASICALVKGFRARSARGTLIAVHGSEEGPMPGLKIIAVLLIVLGVIALVHQGITYTTREKVLEVGPITATKEKKETIPLPPILGAVALVGGVALLVFGARGRP